MAFKRALVHNSAATELEGQPKSTLQNRACSISVSVVLVVGGTNFGPYMHIVSAFSSSRSSHFVEAPHSNAAAYKTLPLQRRANSTDTKGRCRPTPGS